VSLEFVVCFVCVQRIDGSKGKPAVKTGVSKHFKRPARQSDGKRDQLKASRGLHQFSHLDLCYIPSYITVDCLLFGLCIHFVDSRDKFSVERPNRN
jgi:hypothetical protein